MDYTKFIHKEGEFKFEVKDEMVSKAITTLEDIAIAKKILDSYSLADHKIDIDEYFVFFLKEKNDFISSFSHYISNSTLKPDSKTVFGEVLSIMKHEVSDILTKYKLLKQKIFRQERKKEQFTQMKYNFFKNLKTQKIKATSYKDNQKELQGEEKPTATNTYVEPFDDIPQNIENFKESPNVLHIFADNVNKSYEKTKQIIFELGDLMNTVQQKIYEQSEMTKNILYNSFVSVDNIEQGNKELRKAKEYQKGRGICYGLIFMFLGMFLVLYDYIL